ncbi:MAG TPA: hypothetical protein VMN39_13040, partial [Longimicrobiaceae bacterium]|nr:hypothetical protein [Longimicrobiaceae bacterium]
MRGFRQATILAVAITAFIFLFLPGDQQAEGSQQTADTVQIPDTVSIIENVPVGDVQLPQDTPVAEEVRADTLLAAARDEARETV